MKIKSLTPIYLILVISLVVLCLCSPVSALKEIPGSGPASQSEDVGITSIIFIENTFLKAYVENANSRFTLGTTGGDPGNPNDDNTNLLYGGSGVGYAGTSFTTVRIDGVNNELWFSGTPIEYPTVYPGYIRSITGMGDIEITQNLSLAVNPSTGCEDLLKIQYTIENVGTTSHEVGLRIMMDTQLGSNDANLFRVFPGAVEITAESEYTGGSVPDYYQTVDYLATPLVIGYGTLKGGDATVPDRIVFARWSLIVATLWDYTINPANTFGDSAVGLYWNPVTVNAGQTKEYVTYYGLSVMPLISPPIADAGPDKTAVVFSTVSFDGSGSYDPDGTIVAYAWDYGDGGVGSGVTTTHSYNTVGPYTVTLTVTDNDGLTGTDTAQVTILTPCQAIDDLKLTMTRIGLEPVSKRILTPILDTAKTQACTKYGSKTAAINALNQFISSVNSLKQGSRITPSQANTLIVYAQQIITALRAT